MTVKLSRWMCLAATLLGGVSASGLTQAQEREAAAAVLDCMAGNFVSQGSLRELRIVSNEPKGAVRSVAFNLYWKPQDSGPAQINLTVTSPHDLAGIAYLLGDSTKNGEHEVYTYLPQLDRVRQIRGKEGFQNLLGTNFSASDLFSALGVARKNIRLIDAEGRLNGRAVYVLQTADARYSKLLSYVDKQSCTLLRGEYFDDNGEVLKVLEADPSLLFQVETDEKTVWMMLGYTMRDLQKSSVSELSLGEIYLLENVPASAFDPETFYQSFDAAKRRARTKVRASR